jgi:hypothetical protein
MLFLELFNQILVLLNTFNVFEKAVAFRLRFFLLFEELEAFF